MTPKPTLCNSCRFAVQAEGSTEDGFCYRFPPSLTMNEGKLVSMFPSIALNRFWCGEFKAKGKRNAGDRIQSLRGQ